MVVPRPADRQTQDAPRVPARPVLTLSPQHWPIRRIDQLLGVVAFGEDAVERTPCVGEDGRRLGHLGLGARHQDLTSGQ